MAWSVHMNRPSSPTFEMSFFSLFLASSVVAREIVFPPVAAVHGPTGQFPLAHDDPIDITTGSQFSGLTTFAHIPYVNCFVDAEAEPTPYDIAFLGAPFDTARFTPADWFKMLLSQAS